MLPTIDWQDDTIVMVDQRKLPAQELYVRCRTAPEVAKAIRTMVIRGAPAIGVAAAMGIALGMRRSTAKGVKQFAVDFQKTCDLMAATRPTAVNLFWAIERMKRTFAEGAQAGESTDELLLRLEREARGIHDEDVANCKTMGAYGAGLVPDGARVLTHCNAGALATAGYGSALGVIRAAVEQGKRIAVFADETRPFLQGARLTAWELVREGISTTVITESMAGPLMRAGEIDVVVVGADRIAANGDTANKIGTYTVAVLAHEHKIPFYVAAPLSTIDLSTPDGDHIPIEERDQREVSHLGASRLTPEGAMIRNPAFDVTPHRYISGIITERGIFRAPYGESLKQAFAAAAVIGETGNPAKPWTLVSNVVASQTAIHREWGGVVPELASRQHVRDICGVVEAALDRASLSLDQIGAIAVTQGPGLVGSLLVGVAFAKSLALARGIPIVPVHHLAGHIESLTLWHGELPMPAAVLVVSGGHTSLYLVSAPGAYRLIGRTRDDAAGEAYDKVAKLLGLSYPGGPVIDKLAKAGNDRAVDFPMTRLTHADRNAPEETAADLLPPDVARRVDFSFSGLKTAVLRYVREAAPNGRPLPEAQVADICASFQRVVITILLDRTFEAARWLNARSVGIAGGVSANSRLRHDAEERGKRYGLPVFVPPLALSTDNAAMIAAAGLRRLRAGVTGDWAFNAEASLPL